MFNGFGMQTMDAYSSGHLIQSHFRLAYMFQFWHQSFKNGHIEDFCDWVSNNPCNFDFTSQYFEVNEYTPWTVVLKHLIDFEVLKSTPHHDDDFNISTLPWFWSPEFYTTRLWWFSTFPHYLDFEVLKSHLTTLMIFNISTLPWFWVLQSTSHDVDDIQHFHVTLILKSCNLHHTTLMIFNISTLPWFWSPAIYITRRWWFSTFQHYLDLEVLKYTPHDVDDFQHFHFTLILKSWNLHHTTLMIFNISTWRWRTNRWRPTSMELTSEILPLIAKAWISWRCHRLKYYNHEFNVEYNSTHSKNMNFHEDVTVLHKYEFNIGDTSIHSKRMNFMKMSLVR